MDLRPPSVRPPSGAFAWRWRHPWGDAALVVPVHAAVQRLQALHGEQPDPEALTLDERTVLELWQQAESAALEAVWGPHRHLDEGGYQIVPDA